MKIKQKKKQIQDALLSAVFLIFALSGCGAGQTSEEWSVHSYITEDTENGKQEDGAELAPSTDSGNASEESSTDPGNASEENTEQTAALVVHVCGAVKTPGVYSLPEGSRVMDAVDAAGGFSEEVASSAVNLAEKLADGSQLYIPSLEEVAAGKYPGTAQSAVSETGAKEAGESEDKQIININTAGVSELITLPGIGESRAKDIIAYREKNGSFRKTESLMEVPGIKEGTFQKIRDRIRVE
ncbi:MAG: ComEA family DNA-binding protein [Eubacterium sp.]|nr:ComEA family DNA-binding protein [Eubacterium sp.]